MPNPNDLLNWLLNQEEPIRFAQLRNLSTVQREELATHWKLWARKDQLPPQGDWRIWLIMAGRGFGKTRAGSEWVRAIAEADSEARIALVAASLVEARAIMVEGESGLLGVCPPDRCPNFEPSLRRLTWPNGAQATLYSAQEGESLRGPQHSHAWCDEVAKWDNANGRATRTWDNLMLGMRLGDAPRVLATTTPKAVPLVRRLVDGAAGDIVITRGQTEDNKQNLPTRFIQDIRREYGKTLLGRQELDGELITDAEGALWTRALLEEVRDARALVSDMSRRANWSRQTLAWRTAELDPSVTPGALVSVPGENGLWRVNDWEWRDRGIELTLARSIPAVIATGAIGSDSGQFNNPLDALGAPTTLAAFEMPWSGNESDSLPLLFAAASSTSPGWTGAALFVDHGDGQLQPLGSSGRGRAKVGQVLGIPGAQSPHLIDRTSSIDIQLVAHDLALTSCTLAQLLNGSNRALIGEELIQFRDAAPLGDGKWRLSTLLRGRGGTEHAITSHSSGERFVLLDDTPTPLDSAIVGELAQTRIAAIGLADTDPVTSAIACRDITRRPLSPVHPRVTNLADGGIAFGWTRRARGAWVWKDGSETPLNEQTESYEVSCGPPDAPIMAWSTNSPSLILDSAQVAALRSGSSGQPIHVRQQGTFARSLPLFLTNLT